MERTVEYRGDAAHSFTTDMRFTIGNMTAEFGGLNGIFEADEHGRGVAGCAAAVATTTPRATSAPTTTRPTSRATPSTSASLAPQVAKPFSPDNVFDGGRAASGRRSTACFIGACTTTEEELVLGALVLEAALADGAEPQPVESGRRIVVPGDLMIQKRFARAGLWEIYERAGFTVDPPGCSMCLGVASRKAGKGEVWLSSQNRNFENRMGEGSLAWLASAATVAASALVDARRPTHARCWSASTATGWTRSSSASATRRRSRSRSREPRSHVAAQRAGTERQAIRWRRHPRAGAALRRLRRHRRDHPRRVLPPHRARRARRQALPLRAPGVPPSARSEARPSSSRARAGAAAARASRRSGRCRARASQAVIAKSYAFIHKRNLVNEALPYLVIRDEAFYDLATEGAELEVDLASGVVRDVASRREFQAQTPTPMIQALTAEGGLVKAIQTHGKDVFAALTA